MADNLILTGFSGTGKSHVGRLVAQLMGWDFVDTDEEIARRAGKPIADIFSQDGEAHFRQLEDEAITRACAMSHAVVSTGGGAIVDSANHRAMSTSGFIVCLEARPETILERLQGLGALSESQSIRPLLAGPDPLLQIQDIKARRQPHYALADWTVHTDNLAPAEVAQEVLRGWQRRAARDHGWPASGKDAPSFVVRTPSATYPVYVEWGLLDRIGPYLKGLGIGGPIYIITDSHVGSRYAQRVQRSLQDSLVECHIYVVAPGEVSKSLEAAEAIYSWLAEQRCERRHAILALGGGAVGDLAGFVAATFLRGLEVVQVPTSLAAMVDASIGGKTGVNLPAAKNLVGAFHQPRAVLADLDTLRTLPRRELASGWAEAIKHGLILDPSLFELFEGKIEALLELEPKTTAEVVARSMAIKAGVVEEDERETTGRRTILNYGHTIGHALESATRYEALLHGEAVSIGMMAAARISHQMGLLPQDAVERQEQMLRGFGLPTAYPGADAAAVLKAIELDKKAASRKINWVLLEAIGLATLRSDVPLELVEEIVGEICG
ncbi:MAG: 3-dehydroquinate synthase [Chloroflexi bacterium]|nr:3-dehydroquinate synthase [Chloroflexota bacterium]